MGRSSKDTKRILNYTAMGKPFGRFTALSLSQGRIEVFPRKKIFIEKAGMPLKSPPNGLSMAFLAKCLLH